MHDHKTRGKRFCPLMKEWCVNGWTKSMGSDEDTGPKHGACAAWQPVSVQDKKENKVEEVFDCSVFGWTPDLLFECANASHFTTASTDKVATEVRNHHATFLGVLNLETRQRLLDADPRMNTLEHKNGSQGA